METTENIACCVFVLLVSVLCLALCPKLHAYLDFPILDLPLRFSQTFMQINRNIKWPIKLIVHEIASHYLFSLTTREN